MTLIDGLDAGASLAPTSEAIKLKLQEVLIELDQMGESLAAIHVNSAIEILSAIGGE